MASLYWQLPKYSCRCEAHVCSRKSVFTVSNLHFTETKYLHQQASNCGTTAARQERDHFRGRGGGPTWSGADRVTPLLAADAVFSVRPCEDSARFHVMALSGWFCLLGTQGGCLSWAARVVKLGGCWLYLCLLSLVYIHSSSKVKQLVETMHGALNKIHP